METVDNLKKINLSVEAGSTPETMDLTPQPIACEFIFGIGPSGLSPLEYRLAGKRPGDSLLLPLARAEAQRFFEHIVVPIERLFENRDSAVYLRLTVVSVAVADSREIVKAMAETARLSEAGCGGGCGCGCGGSH
jgi:hypothetical protein